MTDDEVAALAAYAASQLRDGLDTLQVRANLLSRGATDDLADRVVSQAVRHNRATGIRRGVLYLVIGAVCLLLGALITGASYSAAAETGGFYITTIGLFGFGIGYTVGGLVRLLKAVVFGR